MSRTKQYIILFLVMIPWGVFSALMGIPLWLSCVIGFLIGVFLVLVLPDSDGTKGE